MQYNGTAASAVQSPAIFVVMFPDYGDIASAALTGVQFNYVCKSFTYSTVCMHTPQEFSWNGLSLVKDCQFFSHMKDLAKKCVHALLNACTCSTKIVPMLI